MTSTKQKPVSPDVRAVLDRLAAGEQLNFNSSYGSAYVTPIGSLQGATNIPLRVHNVIVDRGYVEETEKFYPFTRYRLKEGIELPEEKWPPLSKLARRALWDMNRGCWMYLRGPYFYVEAPRDLQPQRYFRVSSDVQDNMEKRGLLEKAERPDGWFYVSEAVAYYQLTDEGRKVAESLSDPWEAK